MDVFAAVADPVRRSLLLRLTAGPARVVDLAAEHPISRPAVSRHLRVLSDAGLVGADEHGRERYYHLEPAALDPVRDLLAALRPRAPIPESAFDALDVEVRRTLRERRQTAQHVPTEETA